MKHIKRYRGLWVPTVVTTFLFIFLFALRSVSAAHEWKSMSVFQTQSDAGLSDANLVDELSALPLALGIGHVDWKNGSLYVDLRITKEPLSIESVTKDLVTVLSFSFEDKNNINELYLRFEAVDPWSKSRYLILAANVRKDEWDHSLLEEIKQWNQEPFSERVVQGLHLTLTNLWKKMFISE